MSTTPSAQVAVVTGAARGIGLEIAHRFEVENYHVILLDNDKATLQQCKTNLKEKGNYSFEICGWGGFAEFAELRNGFKIHNYVLLKKKPFSPFAALDFPPSQYYHHRRLVGSPAICRPCRHHGQ